MPSESDGTRHEARSLFEPEKGDRALPGGPDDPVPTSDETWRALCEASSEIITVYDARGFIRFSSYIVPGLSADAVIGKHYLELVPPERREPVRSAHDKVLQTGVGLVYESTGPGPNGKMSWYEVDCIPIKRDGKVISLMTMCRDISARRDAERAVESSERRFRALIESSGDGLGLSAADGTALYVSPSCEKLIGWTAEERLGKAANDVIHPEDLERLARARGELLLHPAQRRVIELRTRHKDGSWRWIEVTLTNLLDEPAVGAIVSNFRDVQDRRAADDARDRLEAIVRSTSDSIIATALDGTIRQWNLGAARIYGYSAAEVIGKPIAMLHCPNRMNDVPALLGRLRRGERIRDFETVRRRKDGSDVHMSLALSPIRDQEGNIVEITGIGRDITETKALHTRLLLADRMASMGSLAAGVAHEINNPLAATLANLGALEDDVRKLASDLPPEVAARIADAVHAAQEGAERVRSIASDLRRFSRSDEPAGGAVDLGRVIASSVRLARGEIRHRARLVTDLTDVPAVLGNEGRLCQVVLNLLVNAAQSIDEGQVDDNEIRVTTRTDDAGHVILEVSDTGAGIPPEVIGAIFDPFFTTKSADAGTGLGLSICHDIITSLGGWITAESTVGHGTTFRVTLDALPASHARAAALDETSRAPRGGRRARVLVVDDEPLIVRALELQLGTSHDVETTTSARDALARIREGKRYDVILCDLMMPDVTGMDLYDALEAHGGGLADCMVFMTGGVFTPRAEAFLSRIRNVTLEKPFDMTKLEAAIADRVL